MEKQSPQVIERNQYWYSKLLRSVFEDIKNLNYALIKGDILSYLAYGNFGYRFYHDVDFLLPHEDIMNLKETLYKHGFIHNLKDTQGGFREMNRIERAMYRNTHQDIEFVLFTKENIYDTIKIDLNYDLMWGEYLGKRIDISSFVKEDNSELDIYGVKAKILAPYKNFIQLCLHHYREMNAIYLFTMKNPFKKKAYEDVYFLAKKMSPEDIFSIKEFIRSYQLEPYFYYVLFYTYLLFPDDNISELLNFCENTDAKKLVNYFGLAESERKKWPFSFEERMNCNDLFLKLLPYLSKDDIHKLKMMKLYPF